MKPRHGIRSDTSFEPIAHDDLSAGAKEIHEPLDFAKVTGFIGITNNDESSASSRNSTTQGISVAAGWNMNHFGALLLGKKGRVIGTAVVGHDNFPPDFIIR
jgi:hypothetical protein